jgi:hypothetical protein
LFYHLVFETESCYEAQTVLDLTILLPPPPKCWDYRLAPPRPAQELVFHWYGALEGRDFWTDGGGGGRGQPCRTETVKMVPALMCCDGVP